MEQFEERLQPAGHPPTCATPAQAVLRWHIDHGVVAIPKSARPERIAENFGIWSFSLSDAELRRIDALSRA
jgi:diketogulonate reductase-like aldo/keto reductase